MLSKWEQYGMTEKVKQILTDLCPDTGHHFGRGVLTPYQIAVEFEKQFLNEFQAIALPIGGAGTGQHSSLAQYIAHELSARIKAGSISGIAGTFLCLPHVESISFTHPAGSIVCSLVDPAPLSLFYLT
ncbi:MAG: hypothetical protein ACYDBB_04815 [Armatimonadota bacterium]